MQTYGCKLEQVAQGEPHSLHCLSMAKYGKVHVALHVDPSKKYPSMHDTQLVGEEVHSRQGDVHSKH